MRQFCDSSSWSTGNILLLFKNTPSRFANLRQFKLVWRVFSSHRSLASFPFFQMERCFDCYPVSFYDCFGRLFRFLTVYVKQGPHHAPEAVHTSIGGSLDKPTFQNFLQLVINASGHPFGENDEWGGSNHPDQCSDFCLFTMPSTINSICSAIWCLAELSIKPAPEHSLNGSKLWLLDLEFRQHISLI
jgi:hypothetical protein